MDNSHVRRSTYTFHLPDSSIAKTPIFPRDRSKLLVLHTKTGQIEHRVFSDLPSILPSGTLLVRNNSEVIPARLRIIFETGARGEVFFLTRTSKNIATFFVRPGKKFPVGASVKFSTSDGTLYSVRVLEIQEGGERVLEWDIDPKTDILHILEQHGEMPYPPYIGEQNDSLELRSRYQTVYANETQKGSVAAPTAGLHFTEQTFKDLAEKHIALEDITLHVGAGTFLPVKADLLEDHRMHEEWFEIQRMTATAIEKQWQDEQPVLAVGTTSLRVLEHAYRTGLLQTLPPELSSITGSTDIFIHPPQKVESATMLLTNFHLPESTLLMLVCAFAGNTEMVLHAYNTAIEHQYRFYSFGDAMLLLP